MDFEKWNGMKNLECKVKGVNCGVWNVKSEMSGVKCKLWNGRCGVRSAV